MTERGHVRHIRHDLALTTRSLPFSNFLLIRLPEWPFHHVLFGVGIKITPIHGSTVICDLVVSTLGASDKTDYSRNSGWKKLSKTAAAIRTVQHVIGSHGESP